MAGCLLAILGFATPLFVSSRRLTGLSLTCATVSLEWLLLYATNLPLSYCLSAELPARDTVNAALAG